MNIFINNLFLYYLFLNLEIYKNIHVIYKIKMTILDLKTACTPAKVYLFLAIVSIIIISASGFNLSMIVGNILIYSIFAIFLNWLCSIGYSKVSWAIIIIPFAITLSAGIYVSFNNQVQQLNSRNKPYSAYATPH
jgi:hypothetical protein